MPDTMLKLSSVRIAYGAIEAVKGVDIDVAVGEVVAIIGANGVGKSTLLKGIVGLERLSGGEVRIAGEDCAGLPAHRRVRLGVALSPEGRGIFPDQTVRDNLLLGAYVRGARDPRVESAIEREFERFPRLKEREHQSAGTLSGGEQQMLAIARALMSDPRLLLLDEPSLGLAPLVVAGIFDTIRQLRASGLTIVLVEQMANQALAIADRAYVLENGRITMQGAGRDLLTDPKVRAAYLGAR